MATSKVKAKSGCPNIIHPDNRPRRGMLVPVRYLGKRFYQEWIARKLRQPMRYWLGAEIESRGNPILPDGSLVIGVHEWSVMLVNETNQSWEPVTIELFNREHSQLQALCEIDGTGTRVPLLGRSYYFTSAHGSRVYHLTLGPALLEKSRIDVLGMDLLSFGEKLYMAVLELDQSLKANHRVGS